MQSQQNKYQSEWLNQLNDVDSHVTAATDLFKKIDQLPTADRDQVINRLRSDVRFTESIGRFQPQSV